MDWEDAVDLDPFQPSSNSRIEWLDILGSQRARAVWRLDSGSSPEGYSYACHTPISGWSEPVAITDDRVVRVEARPGGDVVVMGLNADSSGWFEYYAAD